MKKIIAIGTTTQNDKWVNGQSMMFQLLVDKLSERNIKPIIVDFGLSLSKKTLTSRVSGKFTLTKLVDNIIVLFTFFKQLFLNPKTPIYINTSQTKVGFLRDYIVINSSKFFNRKVTVHQFGANYENFFSQQSPSVKNKIKVTLEKADHIIVEGDFTKEQFSFIENYKQKVVSITNGLPEKVDSSKIFAKTITGCQPVHLLYLSNMIESKGYWDVVEAINILVNERNFKINAVFTGKFLGDISDEKFKNPLEAKKAFLDYIIKNNLSDFVSFNEKGLYKKEKSAAFLRAHFFLLPTYYTNEGQPVSVLEALAYGCVPIVTKYRVIPTMVNEENGSFVNPKSPVEIADTIEKYIRNTTVYHLKSQRAINDYLEKFTAEKYVDHIEKLIF